MLTNEALERAYRWERSYGGTGHHRFGDVSVPPYQTRRTYDDAKREERKENLKRARTVRIRRNEEGEIRALDIATGIERWVRLIRVGY